MTDNSERQMLTALGYKINDRRFSDIRKLFSGDYRMRSFQYKDEDVAYSGAEHTGKPKFPNVTFLPNLDAGDSVVLGSTFGHQHLQVIRGDTRQFQEMYEFQGYGAMLLRNHAGTRMHVLKSREKVLVGTEDNMTIFNLDECPLVTLDYAHPERNRASKDLEQGTAIEKGIGSLLMITSGREGIQFSVNQEYNKRGFVRGTREKVTLQVTELGEQVYREIGSHNREFSEMGIYVVYGENIPEGLRKEFSPSLLELVLSGNKSLLGLFEIEK